MPSQAMQGGPVGYGTCLVECSGAQVEVRDAAGIVVLGALRLDSVPTLLWQPEQPLELGERYTLTVSGLRAESAGGSFEVVTRVEPIDEGVQVGSLSVTTELIESGSVCCLSTIVTDGCRRPPSCLVTHRGGAMKVAVSMTNLEQKSAQWFFAGGLEYGTHRFGDQLDLRNGYRFEKGDSSLEEGPYCAQVEAISRVDEERAIIYEECQDVALTLPDEWQEEPARVEAFLNDCKARGDTVQLKGKAVPRQDRSYLADEGYDLEPQEASGCQLAGNRSHILTAVIVLFALGLGAGWRRRE